ncbi:MAG: DNA gyrase subunit A [Candidatus Poseidonia sp.]|nr:DNA gyrase subunit A [Poseidonia sp.]MBL6806129.1 DNA gyrase subunit A [Poseidonia sp.]MBL6886149.1 DNA gyrase subunit A [Poseidonia sp.]MBL6892166.1 DNA gyrase subunit A [Poseidonia sp.]
MTSDEETSDIEDGSTASGENILNHSLNTEMKNSYINYAMSVIIGRALPDARDGLKPVHRRVLYGMFEGGHTSEKKFSKSARSVGEVMGKYHPHGDQSIYDTMVRMAQEFSLRYPLVDGQGNFGSIDGDPPAAMRYTESRLDRIANHMLDDINKDTVDFQSNFDDSEQEPTVLPSRLPNLLLNGSDGIAVGMATRIPPHNLTEVAGAVNMHVERILEEGQEGMPIISIEEYMRHVRGPDFPTGASIHGIDGIEDMYATGQGRFHVRSKCDVLDDENGKRIVIHEIPYQVKKADMLVHIADLVNKEVVLGIRDIRDESSKEGIRVVIEVKNNADPHAVLNQLFKSSRLQESYSANMMGILDGRPVLLTLPVMIHTYVEHRESVIERRAVFNLGKAQARAHILEGLVKAQDRIDDVVAVGKASSSREQFESVLRGDETMPGIAVFDFTEAQAKAIAERRLYQLSRLDVANVMAEHEELKVKIADLEDIIASRPRRLSILKEELAEVVDRHGDERRSFIDPMPLSMDREDLIEERAIVITLSEDNYIRHTPVETFRTQNRGGRGLKGVTTKTEDTPQLVITCFSKDRLLIFTDQGRVYGLKAWETPIGSRQSRGSHIRNLLESLREDENIVTILPLSRELFEEPEDHYLLFATKLGLIKKTALSEYVRINRNGKYALRFKLEGDSLVNVRSATNEHDIVMISTTGYASRFSCLAIRASGRVSGGIYGIKVADRKGSGGGVVAGMVAMLGADEYILTISKFGMAKRSRLGTADRIQDTNAEGEPKFDEDGQPKMVTDGYRLTKPGAKGVRTMKLEEEYSDSIISVRTIPDLNDHLFLLTKSGMMIRIRVNQTKETSGKSTRGTRVMELRDKKNGGFVDELIFSSRISASLLDIDDEDEEGNMASEGSEEEE